MAPALPSPPPAATCRLRAKEVDLEHRAEIMEYSLTVRPKSVREGAAPSSFKESGAQGQGTLTLEFESAVRLRLSPPVVAVCRSRAREADQEPQPVTMECSLTFRDRSTRAGRARSPFKEQVVRRQGTSTL